MNSDQSSDILGGVLFEIRRRLQSVSCFVKFNRQINNCVIAVEESEIISLHLDGILCKISFADFGISGAKLTNSQHGEKYAFVRLRTDNSNCISGGFKTELLPLINSMTRASLECPTKMRRDWLDFVRRNGQTISICCPNPSCDSAIMPLTTFKRVLPLPSSDCNMSDWFCHGSSGGHSSTKLTPNQTDLFYTSSYIHINSAICMNFKLDADQYYCSKCSVALSKLIKNVNDQTCVYRCNEIKLKSRDDLIFPSLSDIDPWSELLALIRETQQKPLPGELPCQRNRILFRCYDSQNVMLFWIVERDLLIRAKCFGGNTAMLETKCARCLYKKLDYNKVDNDVAAWRADPNVVKLEISMQMLSKLVEHFDSTSHFIPEEYSQSNGFLVAYFSESF